MKLWFKSCIGSSKNYFIDDINEGTSISQLKEIIAEHESMPMGFLSQLRLLHSGRDVRSDRTCHECGITDEHSVEVCLRLQGGMPNKKKKNKKKKGGKKSKKKKELKADEQTTEVVDEFSVMNIEELARVQRALHSKLSDVQQQRSYFQLERETVQKMLDLTNGALSKHSTDIKNIESRMQSLRNCHRNNIRMYVQKVKHLSYDQQNTLSSINLECEMLSNEQMCINAGKKQNLLQHKKRLAENHMHQKLENETEIEALRAKNALQLQALRKEFEDKLYSDLHSKLEAELKELESDLHLQMKLEVHEICERKNMHINDLMSAHENLFQEMRTYYNHITRDNLDLIRGLKSELSELALKSTDYDSNIEKIQSENERLSVPLKKARKKHASLEKSVANHSKDRRSLKAKRNRLFSINSQIEQTSKKYMSLKLQFQAMQEKKAALVQGYKQVCKDGSKHKKSAKEERLESMQSAYNHQRHEFATILESASVDRVVAEHLTSKLSSIMDEKNADIESLRFERARLTKATNDLLRVYQQKLLAKKYEHVIPVEQIKHIPFLPKHTQNFQPNLL